MLLFLSNEIVAISKEVVGSNILDDPLRVILFNSNNFLNLIPLKKNKVI